MLSLGLCEATFGERDTRCTRRQKCHWRHLKLNAVEEDLEAEINAAEEDEEKEQRKWKMLRRKRMRSMTPRPSLPTFFLLCSFLTFYYDTISQLSQH
jgi:hypothetical protein